uniref:Uncharacterized protein n=1 Tax=Anguilla anguilla TaxID=7936 RepID=A0A0E9Q7G4_ANGAN
MLFTLQTIAFARETRRG